MTPDLVILVGPPGAGASGVGRVLARRWGVPLRDTDRDVESRFGTGLPEIFLDAGEAAFRDVEREIALDALIRPAADRDDRGGVLVLGGGCVLDPVVAEALRARAAVGATVVFLDVTIGDAARRLRLNAERPSGIGAPRAQWIRMMELRRPVYRDLATVTVSTDERTLEQVAEAVCTALADGGEER